MQAQPNSADAGPLLTIPEAAQMVRCSISTIKRMQREGTLSRVHLPGVRRTFLHREEVQAIIPEASQNGGPRAKRRSAEEVAERVRVRARAHRTVSAAIKRGELVRPPDCEQCGVESRQIHAHHEDYDRPLAVEWLCPGCHARRHAGPQRSSEADRDLAAVLVAGNARRTMAMASSMFLGGVA